MPIQELQDIQGLHGALAGHADYLDDSLPRLGAFREVMVRGDEAAVAGRAGDQHLLNSQRLGEGEDAGGQRQ